MGFNSGFKGLMVIDNRRPAFPTASTFPMSTANSSVQYQYQSYGSWELQNAPRWESDPIPLGHHSHASSIEVKNEWHISSTLAMPGNCDAVCWVEQLEMRVSPAGRSVWTKEQQKWVLTCPTLQPALCRLILPYWWNRRLRVTVVHP